MIIKKGRFIMPSRLLIIALFIFIFVDWWLPGESVSSSEEQRIAKLIEGARQEGKMTWYALWGMLVSTTVITRFEEKYPFIKVELYRAPWATLLNKLTIETRTKKYTADVVNVSGFPADAIKKEGLYAGYISPESRAYREGFKDQDGSWNSVYIIPYLMGYNTKLLSRKDIPDTYEGFLNPRWKGKKIGFDIKEVEWFANMLKFMGEERGMDFFRKLVAQQLAYRSGHTLIADLIIAGEFPVGTVFPQNVEEKKKNGAPVDWVGVSPLIVKFGTVGLVAHAPHSNAGKLFIDFVLSKEGQLVIASTGMVPARPDVEADIVNALKGLNTYPSDLSLADKFTAYSKKFAEALRSGGDK